MMLVSCHLEVLLLLSLMEVGPVLARSPVTCPEQCLCLSQIQVLCNTGNLTEIPRKFPPDTQEIVITNQNITTIPKHAFSDLKHLKRLVLDSNNISVISQFAFKNLHDMEEISIQNNPLRELPSFSFAGIRNVSIIYLGYNQLQKIDSLAFPGTQNITMLLLNNNPIKTVNSSAFSGLNNVEFLFLPAGVQNLHADAFKDLESVGVLKLAYLDLNELKPYTFRGLKRVRILTIENSDLGIIRRNAFAEMSHIGELNLASDKIDRIEGFGLTSDIHKLNLKGNHILDVPSQSALQAINVREIKAVDNHFPCNCRVLFLLNSRIGQVPHFMRENKCISPYLWHGKDMSVMEQEGVLSNCTAKLDEMKREDREKEDRRRRKEEEAERWRQQQHREKMKNLRRRMHRTTTEASNEIELQHRLSTQDATEFNGSCRGCESHFMVFFSTCALVLTMAQ